VIQQPVKTIVHNPAPKITYSNPIPMPKQTISTAKLINNERRVRKPFF
jgi:hypothetical protein